MTSFFVDICMISYVVTILGCLLWRLEYGIILGMGVDLLPILYLSAVPDTKCTTANGCLHINLASGLLFPGLSSFKNAILSRSLSDYHKVVLHLESVSYLDYSTIKALIVSVSLHSLRVFNKNSACRKSLKNSKNRTKYWSSQVSRNLMHQK